MTSPEASTPSCRSRQRAAAVELVPPGHGAVSEAFIEAVWRIGGHVVVTILLADGSDAMAELDAHDWDWLELNAGDIASVRRVGSAAVSA